MGHSSRTRRHDVQPDKEKGSSLQRVSHVAAPIKLVLKQPIFRKEILIKRNRLLKKSAYPARASLGVNTIYTSEE